MRSLRLCDLQCGHKILRDCYTYQDLRVLKQKKIKMSNNSCCILVLLDFLVIFARILLLENVKKKKK